MSEEKLYYTDEEVQADFRRLSEVRVIEIFANEEENE